MGTANAISREFMSNPNNFADSFNLAFQIYGYTNMFVDASSLQALDTNQTQKLFGTVLERFSDVFKSGNIFYDNKYYYMALLVENQHYVHTGMPLKILSYILLDLIQQVKDEKALHPSDKQSSDEFLSNYPSNFKLRPIVPLVIYFGPNPWTAPKNLADMFEEVPETLKRLLPHQEYLVLTPADIQDEFFKTKTDFRLVLQAMKHAQTKTSLVAFFKNSRDYASVSRSLAEMIAANVCFNVQNITLTEKNNMYDISHFWDESDARLRQEGYDQGHTEGYDQGHNDGVAEGFERGDKQGFERGDKQGYRRCSSEFITKMVEKGCDIDFICDIAGVDRQQVESMIDAQKQE